MASTPLAKLLGSSDVLSRLQDHALRLVRMQRLVDTALPPALQGRAQVANFSEGKLTLHVQSPAMATRLKLSLETLKETLYAAGQVVTEVKVKVRAVPYSTGYAEHAPSRHIGLQGRESLQSLSDSLKPDDPLAQALKRMVKNSA